MSAPDLPEIDGLRLQRRGAVLTVLLDRPEARNALTRAMVDGLHRVFAHLAEPPAVRAVVLRGAGGTFCAGGDVADMLRAASEGPDGAGLRATNRAFGAMLEAAGACPAVTVAAVEGVALGGGFGLCCAVDVTLAHQGAAFGMPEVRLGIPPAQIAPFVVRRIGAGAARFLAVTGRRIDAALARDLGVAHLVADDVDAAVEALLGDVLRCAPQAVATTKAIVADAAARPTPAVLDDAAEAFARTAGGSEAREGLAAFLAKRRPSWTEGT